MKFKCVQSGVVIEFTQEQDIKTTLENPAYVEYVEPIVEKKKVVSKVEE
jgi:hypothetical protein